MSPQSNRIYKLLRRQRELNPLRMLIFIQINRRIEVPEAQNLSISTKGMARWSDSWTVSSLAPNLMNSLHPPHYGGSGLSLDWPQSQTSVLCPTPYLGCLAILPAAYLQCLYMYLGGWWENKGSLLFISKATSCVVLYLLILQCMCVCRLLLSCKFRSVGHILVPWPGSELFSFTHLHTGRLSSSHVNHWNHGCTEEAL